MRRHAWLWILLVGAAWLPASCARFGKGQAASADKTGYSIIAEKQKSALGESKPFSLEAESDEETSRLLSALPRIEKTQDSYTTPSFLLSLPDTLAIAFAKSRDYKSRKEDLFSAALGLSNTRYDFGPIFSADASANVTRDDSAANTSGKSEWFGGGGVGAGVKQTLATGANVSLGFTKSFVHYITGDARESSTNNASLNVVQPLLNGAGPLVAREGLRQAERDMIYSVRDFQRYQQSFVIEVASSYYQLLQQLDRLNNERLNFKNALMDLDKAIMMAAAGRIADFERDRARQRALDAENRWNDAQTEYLARLDRFKLKLGLPLDMDAGPDPSELETIRGRGLVLPDMDADCAIEIAIENRLDFKTTGDHVADSERGVKIALQNFLPNLDAKYQFSSSKGVKNDTDLDMALDKNTQVFGFDLALPLDWTPRRNRYRRALIAQEQAKRSFEEKRDQIILEVRDNYRQLERTRKNYEIQMLSVELAARRVESTQLMLDSGEATTRDLLDAQDALITSKNALTDALVTYTIQRLEFWNSIERLKIDAKGMWYE